MPWRYALKRILRARGLQLIRVADPFISSLERLPTLDAYECGPRENYYLPAGYQSRTETRYFNDTRQHDEYGKEVYEVARMFADREGCHSVCDVGCGSGYKLIRNFREYNPVVGVDVPETVEWLRQKHPKFTWLTERLEQPSSIRADLVIACDVIEHVLDPDALITYIKSIRPRLVVLTTPERNQILAGRHFGPPGNPSHIREWGYADFRRYVGDHFDILYHFVVNPFQSTQMVVVRPR